MVIKGFYHFPHVRGVSMWPSMCLLYVRVISLMPDLKAASRSVLSLHGFWLGNTLMVFVVQNFHYFFFTNPPR